LPWISSVGGVACGRGLIQAPAAQPLVRLPDHRFARNYRTHALIIATYAECPLLLQFQPIDAISESFLSSGVGAKAVVDSEKANILAATAAYEPIAEVRAAAAHYSAVDPKETLIAS